MLDGTYNISLNTPLGGINGKLSLFSNPTSVEGVIEVMEMKNSFKGSKLSDNMCQFSGNLPTPLGNVSYTATCEVRHNTLELNAKTNLGNIKILGARV